MPLGAAGWTRDPDHATRWRGQAAVPAAPPALGGVSVDASGNVLRFPSSIEAARQRMWQAVGAATPGIPAAGPSGDLPAGVHQASWGELLARYAHGERRDDLSRQLGTALGKLHSAGVEQVIVGGSYVGSKLAPGDVDLAVIPRRDGRELDWSRITKQLKRVAPDVHAYAGERIVSNAGRIPGATPGENFAELFQHTRSGVARGALLVQAMPPPAGPITNALTGVVRLFRA